jgi:hypothetical protein
MTLHVPPAPPPTVPPAALQAPRTASCGLNSTRRILGFRYGFFVFACVFCLSGSFMSSPKKVLVRIKDYTFFNPTSSR